MYCKQIYPLLAIVMFLTVFSSQSDAGIKLSKETEKCLNCHKSMNPGLVQPWEQSRHATSGVGCYECH
ncbi:MAG TPA: multiheme c-type cytochrome, partial [Thermodesulfovibrionia bacterium]|nr:multiheme c-type cytochrome [Thermodesulfovibrionia bacterium]